MQKMSYFKVEPRRNVTILAQSRHSKYCFFHRTRRMLCFSLTAGSTGIVEHQRARPFSLYSTAVFFNLFFHGMPYQISQKVCIPFKYQCEYEYENMC